MFLRKHPPVCYKAEIEHERNKDKLFRNELASESIFISVLRDQWARTIYKKYLCDCGRALSRRMYYTLVDCFWSFQCYWYLPKCRNASDMNHQLVEQKQLNMLLPQGIFELPPHEKRWGCHQSVSRKFTKSCFNTEKE